MQVGIIFKASGIFLVFLLLNLPFASATEISLVFGTESRSFSFTPSKFVRKEISIRNERVFLNITPEKGYSIRRILLFPCRGLNPVECIREEPIEYESYSHTYLNLEDMVENGKGGLMTLVMLNTTSWVGFWDSYEGGEFAGRELGSLGLETNRGVLEVEDLVSNYGMIPLNWVEKADFRGKTLYQAEAEALAEGLNFTKTRESKALMDTRSYLFAFPGDSRIYNPLVFYYQPPVECGNQLCELGESQASCCRDCGCPENQSCSRTGCIPASDIRLVLDSMKPSLLECIINEGECTFQELLELGLHIENAPLDYWINDYFFSFGNKDYKEMACIPGEDGNGFSCTILLPAMDRDRGFQEKRVLSLYLSIGYMEIGKVRAEELSLNIDLEIKGTDLEQELGLQSYKEKLAQMQKTLDKIQGIMDFINTLFMIYSAWQAFNTAMAIMHEGLAQYHQNLANACAVCCGAANPGCCVCWKVNTALAALHHSTAGLLFVIAAMWAAKALTAQIAMMVIKSMIQKWTEYRIGELEDELKQDMERIKQDTMCVVGDEVEGIGPPLLVWAKGSFSGEYTETVCDEEMVEIWYDFTALNCSGGLWLAPGGMVKQRVNETGRHMLLSAEATKLFPGRKTMDMAVECNSTRYYNSVTDAMPFLNYTETCGEVPEPLVELERPANGTSQASRDIELAYSVTHPLRISSCTAFVNKNPAYTWESPEAGKEYGFSLNDLLPGGYRWGVECEDSQGLKGSSGEWEFSIES